MLLELIVELAALAVMVICGYAGIHAYVSLRRPHLTRLLVRRRLTVLGFLMLMIVGIKAFEDVLGKESGAVDEMLLWVVHTHVPAAWKGFFAGLTVSGSAIVLMPTAAVMAVALAAIKRRFEGGLVIASLTTAALLVYAIKSGVGRVRPALWETQWYWGSSFPSGHTTNTAAFSTAAALCLARIWPRSGGWAIGAALLWTSMVALSRLVLGVHWPTDVLAAICLGVLIPLMISLGFDLYRHVP